MTTLIEKLKHELRQALEKYDEAIHARRGDLQLYWQGRHEGLMAVLTEEENETTGN